MGVFASSSSFAAVGEAVTATISLTQDSPTIYRDKTSSSVTTRISGTGSFTQTLDSSHSYNVRTAGIETLHGLTVTGSGASVTLNAGTHIFAGQWGRSLVPTISKLEISEGTYTLYAGKGQGNGNGWNYYNDSTIGAILLGFDGSDRLGHGNYGGMSLLGATGDVVVSKATIDTNYDTSNSGNLQRAMVLSAYGSISLTNVHLNFNGGLIRTLGRAAINQPEISSDTSTNLQPSSDTNVGNITISNAAEQVRFANSAVNAYRNLSITANKVEATGSRTYLWGEIGTTTINASKGEALISLSDSAHVGAVDYSSHASAKSSTVYLTADKIDIQSGAGVDGGAIDATTKSLVVQGRNSHFNSTGATDVDGLETVKIGGDESGQEGGTIGNGSGSVSLTFTESQNGEGLSLKGGAAINSAKVTVDTKNRDVVIDSNSSIAAGANGATINAGSADVTMTAGGSITSANGSNNAITANSVSLSGGSHIGTSNNDGSLTGGNIEIDTPTLTLDDQSFIASAGNVSVVNPDGSGNVSITMDGNGKGEDEADSWIKGSTVNVGAAPKADESGQTVWSQQGSVSIKGGSVEGSSAVNIYGGNNGADFGTDSSKAGAFLEGVTVSGGNSGSVSIKVPDGNSIVVGAEGEGFDSDTNKDTEILGQNVTIGNGSGESNTIDISINDAQIGYPASGSSVADSSITINGGTGEIEIVDTNIAVTDGKTTGTGTDVAISGGDVSIGKTPDTNPGTGSYDTQIGGDNIQISGSASNGSGGQVTIGNAQIGDNGKTGEQENADGNVSITVADEGKIEIGSAEGKFDTSIAGGSVVIGGSQEGADATVDIKGQRPTDPEAGEASSTQIKGDGVSIDGNGGSITIDDVDIALNDGDTADKEIVIGVDDDGKLSITDTNIDATGNSNGTGTGSGNGSVQISGGMGTGDDASAITGSNIASGGNTQLDGNLDISGSDIEAGVNVTGPGQETGYPSGSVIFGDATTGTDSNIVIGGGSTVAGDGVVVRDETKVDLGKDDQDTGSNIFVNGTDGILDVNAGGELNVGPNGDVYGENNLNVIVGTDASAGTGTVNIDQGASIVAGVDKKDDGTVAESEDGGNLTISGGGDVNVNGGTIGANGGATTKPATEDDKGPGNVYIDGGDVNLSTGGKIEADGVVNVGDSDGESAQTGSVNVDAGDTGAIIVKDEAGTGQSVAVNKGGIVSVGNDGTNAEGAINQGSLVVTTDPEKAQGGTGGLTLDDNINVSVEDGGYVASNDINFGNNSKLEIENGGGLYTDGDTILDNAGKGENSNLVFDFDPENEEGADIQVSGEVTKNELDQIRGMVGNNSSLVVDHVDGVGEGEIITKEEMLNDYAGAVIGDAVIDVSSDNKLSFGGGGSIMVGGDTLTITKPAEAKGEPNTGVVITGSETDPNKQVVVGKDPNDKGPFNIKLEDGVDITFGKDGAAGGTFNGSITASGKGEDGDASDLNTVGGDFTLNGDVNLSNGTDIGDINIIDRNTTNDTTQNGFAISGNVTAEDLNMSGSDTNLDVGGKLDLAGNANLSGNADVDTADKITVAGDLNLAGGSSVGSNSEFGTAAGENASLDVTGNLNVADNASIDRGEITVGKDAFINGNGGVSADGNFSANGSIQIGTGATSQPDATTQPGNPNVDVAGGNLTTGSGDLVIGQGEVSVTGPAGSENAGNIVVGSAEDGTGNLVIGNEGNTPKTPAFVDVANDVTVNDGSANIYDNANVAIGGAFEVHDKGGDNSPAGAGSAAIEGSLTAGSADIDHNLTIGSADKTTAPNGSFTSNGVVDVGGDLTINAGGSYVNNGTHGDETTDTNVSGNLVVGGNDAGSASASADLGDAVVGGTTTINKGNVESGNFTGHDDLTVNAGGTLTAQGGDIVLSAGEGASDGRADLVVNGGSVVSKAEGSGDSAAGGNITVDGIGDISSGSVMADGKLEITGVNENGDSLIVGSDDSDGASASVNVGELNVDKGNTLVHGNGSLASAGNANLGGNLTVGDAGSVEQPNGSFTAGGSAQINGNLIVNDNGEVAIGTNSAAGEGGNLTVNGSTELGGNAAVNVAGDITFGAGDSAFAMGEGSKVAASGSVTFGQGSLAQGNLQGFITAPDGLDLSNLSGPDDSDPTFAGSTAGFQTGNFTGDVALENGANAVLTPQTGDDGSTKAPSVNGWITAAAGTDSTTGSTITTNPEHMGTHADMLPSGSAQNAVIYMDTPMSFGENGGLVAGTIDSTTELTSGIYFGANSAFVLNAESMASGTVLFQNGTANGMSIHASGVTADNPVTIDMSNWLMGEDSHLVFNATEAEKDLYDFNSSNVLQKFGLNFENGVGTIGMEVLNVEEVTKGTLSGDLANSVYQVTRLGNPDYVVRSYNQIFSKPGVTPRLNPEGSAEDKAAYDALVASGQIEAGATDVTVTPYGIGYVGADGKQYFRMSEQGTKTVEEVATFPVMSGAFNAAYDYLTEFNRVVENRALDDRMHDRNHAVWAQVIATYNKSDELFNGSGYKADLYGGVLGTDARLANGTLIGGALTVGTGDIESRGAQIGTENDATFYGLSLYAEHAIGELALKGDVTYLRTENDIAGTFEGIDMGGSMDTDAISVGVRAEFTAYAGDVFSVKPHLGIRYTNYSFDDYRGTEVDDVSVLETPVGVAFSGKVAAEGGWTVVPELDLTVVPQLGDKEATVVNAGAGVDQRVLEGAVFNAKFGLGLQKDNFSFGANFQHGEGGYGRNNNAFQAYARWLF